MKILHTADWHIGQTLNGWSREVEHRAFLDQLHDLVLSEQVDVLMVSGDIFDNSFVIGQVAEADVSGSHSVLGVNINLFIFKLGLEHSRLFGSERTTAKVSFYF